MRQEQDDLFCRIYVDGITGEDELTRLLAGDLDGSIVGREIEVGKTYLAIRASDSYDRARSHDPLDGFMHFPLRVEVAALLGQDRVTHIGVTRKTLESLWAHDLTAVASCDYEQALPQQGYNSRGAPELPAT